VADADSTALDEFDVKTETFNWDSLVDDIETNAELSTSLDKDEIEVNSDPALHMFRFEGKAIDTKIVVCPHCRNRYLRLAMETHQLERHSTLVEEEAEQPE
jgi:hypothetical protein